MVCFFGFSCLSSSRNDRFSVLFCFVLVLGCLVFVGIGLGSYGLV